MFEIGQKIVCIDGLAIRADCHVGMPQRPTAGAVYTVRSIQTEPHIDGYGVRLEEILNPSMLWSDGEEREWSYDHRRFRPMESPAVEAAMERFHDKLDEIKSREALTS